MAKTDKPKPNPKLVLETGIALGQFWFSHKRNRSFYQQFLFLSVKEYSFLKDLAEGIETSVMTVMDDGWETVEGRFVWEEFIKELVDRIYKVSGKYSDTDAILKDMNHLVWATYQREET